jgi:hypothetical protein
MAEAHARSISTLETAVADKFPGAVGGSDVAFGVALSAVFEYGPTLFAASFARTR